ncbi:MAG TPA: [FeFe] hydrogenase H-cluster radical SAM maturase HydE [Syntrophales bacterium]|nr:[FeFe] hydrogenase H-cluster radical SAM maturase HydE [Syntrophales bacterium]HPQ43795.1 [FeFe] hydrogenase H-cluster radical SAM maturase HydE [Syntrophales bacterium]
MKRDEILCFLRHPDGDTELLQIADDVRKKRCGDDVHIRGIIEFSNHCCRNCLYCGLRRDNKELDRYRMTEEEIVDCARRLVSAGTRTIVLQSGDDFHYTRSMICRIIERIKESGDVAVTLSLGERPLDDYRAFRIAGADRYLLKHETANRDLYRQLHPGQDLEERVRILTFLRSIGYQIGSGNIVGLPGQTSEDLCEDILLLGDLDADMSSVGLFIPQHDTPLSENPPGDIPTALRVLALARIMTQNSHMPVTTAVATADPERGLVRGLMAGANVIMPDYTPDLYRTNYVIYDGKRQITLERAKEAIREAGRTIADTRGDSLKRKPRSMNIETI